MLERAARGKRRATSATTEFAGARDLTRDTWQRVGIAPLAKGRVDGSEREPPVGGASICFHDGQPFQPLLNYSFGLVPVL